MATIKSGNSVETLKKVMGVEDVEITIRGEKLFTISFEGKNTEAVSRLKKYLGKNVVFEDMGDEYDEECEMTFIYFAAI